MPTYEHTGLGLKLVVKDDLLTRDIEAWSRETRLAREKAERVKAFGGVSMYEDFAITLRAALKIGAVIEPAMSFGQVGDLPPAHTRWYAERLSALYVELTEVPKE